MGRAGAGHLPWHRPPAKRAAQMAEVAQRGVINAFSYQKRKEKEGEKKKKRSESL